MTALLAIHDLSIDAGGQRLVQNLSFSLQPGERLGLIGESGSGKSLTALAVNGLLPRGLSATGSIRLGDTEMVGTPDRALVSRRGALVATVFQEPLTALDPLMRVGRQVAEPLARRLRRTGQSPTAAQLDRGVQQLFDDVALPDPARLARAYPHELSGGQRQRVAIAMALACEPRLLIADEPTTALDVTTQAEILRLLDTLVHDRGMALLFISHDLPVVAGAVERVVVLRHGEAVEAGDVENVFRSPRHPYTQSLLAAAQSFDRALEGRP